MARMAPLHRYRRRWARDVRRTTTLREVSIYGEHAGLTDPAADNVWEGCTRATTRPGRVVCRATTSWATCAEASRAGFQPAVTGLTTPDTRCGLASDDQAITSTGAAADTRVAVAIAMGAPTSIPRGSPLPGSRL